jgi:hypothetical protein
MCVKSRILTSVDTAINKIVLEGIMSQPKAAVSASAPVLERSGSLAMRVKMAKSQDAYSIKDLDFGPRGRKDHQETGDPKVNRRGPCAEISLFFLFSPCRKSLISCKRSWSRWPTLWRSRRSTLSSTFSRPRCVFFFLFFLLLSFVCF